MAGRGLPALLKRWSGTHSVRADENPSPEY